MRSGRWHLLPLLGGAALVALGVALGNWQVRRAAQKLDLQHTIEASWQAPAVPLPADGDAQEWERVVLHGHWLPAHSIYLDNRVYHGKAGYYLLTPLRRDRGDVVLVSRGWLPARGDRRLIPVATPSGPVTVEGVVRRPEAKPFTLADRPANGALWEYLDLAAYAQQSGLAVGDQIVQQTSAADDGLVRDWPRPDTGIQRHQGYALQWYGLATLAGVMTGIYIVRRFKRHEE